MEERITVSLTENDWSKVRQALLEKVFKEREISINLNLPSSTSTKYNELYHWIGYEIEKHYEKEGAK